MLASGEGKPYSPRLSRRSFCKADCAPPLSVITIIILIIVIYYY